MSGQQQTGRRTRVLGGLTLDALAAITAVISYQHGLEVVGATGTRGFVAYLVPVVADLMIFASSLALLDAAQRNQPRPPLAVASLVKDAGAVEIEHVEAVSVDQPDQPGAGWIAERRARLAEAPPVLPVGRIMSAVNDCDGSGVPHRPPSSPVPERSMYPPSQPVPPRPVPPRHGMPAGGVVGLAVACSVLFGMGGCAVGYAMATPADSTTGAAGPVRETTLPAAAETSPVASPSRTVKPKPKTPTITDGTWRVPQEVKPGTWRTTGGESCYWARLRGFSGRLSDVIANELADGGSVVVTIKPGDKGFSSRRCGTWKRIGK